MLALAGDFGHGPLTSPEPAPFIGSKRCGECHRFLYHQQQRASRHAQTLRLGADLRDVPLPSRAVADPHFPGLSHSFTRISADRIEIKSRIADRAIGAIIEYAVGSGRHGITMVAKDEQGIDRELRVSYFGEGQTWGETKGITAPPREPGDQIGLALAPKPLRHCLHCHSTWFGAVDISRSAPKGPEALDRGIGCERCHGPGLNHIKAVESGFAQAAIALSARSPSNAKLQSCTECHASDGSIEPSDPEFTRAQGTTLLFSRCFTATGGQLGCTTCHDPHRVLDNTISHYETKCLECQPKHVVQHGEEPSSSLFDDWRAHRFARPELSGQPGGQLRLLPHAPGRDRGPAYPVYRPPHPRASRLDASPGGETAPVTDRTPSAWPRWRSLLSVPSTSAMIEFDPVLGIGDGQAHRFRAG